MAGESTVSQDQLDTVRRGASDQLDALRYEVNAGLTTVGVQIGAVEKSLQERLSSLKAWGIAALVGGQALSGVFAHYLPGAPVQTAASAFVHFFS